MSASLKSALIVLALCVLALCSVAAYVVRWHSPFAVAGSDTLLLLLPDAARLDDPTVQEWLDAASEEGLHLAVIRDSEFLQPTSEVHCAGLIVPDEVHRTANDALIGGLYRYAQGGGQLMLVYDAGTWDLNGLYTDAESRLSPLAGVHYAMYQKFGTDMIHWGEVWSSPPILRDLDLPPGKFVPLGGRGEPGGKRAVSLQDAAAHAADKFTIARYGYAGLEYPSFRTAGDYDGQALLESKSGLVAGYRHQGRGGVLFVNLPVAYLESRTDGLLLHSFLRYFALNMLQLPAMASVPDGIGGLVLNWQIDDAAALPALERMKDNGLFAQGPFSEHITAGPDARAPHDHRGFDVLHDPAAQRWVQFFAQRGDQVGSHGGWMHQWFGSRVNEENGAQFQRYIAMNNNALEKITGRPVTEYSAPMGNQPQWVTRWLQDHGFLAYYFTGNSGMGPTQVYRDGVRDGPLIWAFPILHMGRQASLEEMEASRVGSAAVRDWLLQVTDYTAHEHVARLFYSHPPDDARYLGALRAWFAHTGELLREGNFRWYTMTGLAQFLNRRKEVSWSIERNGSRETLEANHPQSLAGQAWMLPQTRYEQPRVVEGKASVRAADGFWIVAAAEGKRLRVKTELK